MICSVGHVLARRKQMIPLPPRGSLLNVSARPPAELIAMPPTNWPRFARPHAAKFLERFSGLKVLAVPDKRLKLPQCDSQVFKTSDQIFH
jgi:hypothetical protein